MNPECCPRCVRCHSPRHVRASGSTPRAYYCGRCRIEFEAEDDTDIGYGPPDRRLLRQERQAEARRQRLGGQAGGSGLRGGLGR
jgi:hypothetical protein